VPAVAPGSDCSAVPGAGVMGCAALQPLTQPGLGLSCVPSLPCDVELCLAARGRRRKLDTSEIAQFREMNLPGQHYLQPCR